MVNYMITVFTPTYNRKKMLPKLYQSLLIQDFKDFEWIIVDDGSSDGTEEYIYKILKENKIKIRYYKQNNSGKHVAFNCGVGYAKGELFICVDSDDLLTQNALLLINDCYYKYRNSKKKIAGFVFLKGYDEVTPVTKKFPEEGIKNYNSFIINSGFKGDKAEVFITSIIKKYEFPIYENEKFLAEGFLCSRIGRDYDYVFINKIIYLCEYLPDGLTKSGRRLRLNNPIGGLAHANEYLDSSIYSLKIRIKNYILYDVYSISCKKKYHYIPDELYINDLYTTLLYLPSLILYYMWNKKN